MSDEKKAFTVNDRRHFASEGDAPSPEPATPAAPEPAAVEPGAHEHPHGAHAAW